MCSSDLGVAVVGRPSCIGCEQELALCAKMFSEVVIIPDNDSKPSAVEAVERGLERLRGVLKVRNAVVYPPLKDVRESIAAGWTARDLEDALRSVIWKV